MEYLVVSEILLRLTLSAMLHSSLKGKNRMTAEPILDNLLGFQGNRF